MEMFTKDFLYITLSCGVITTFVVSALNTVQNKVSTNWLVFIIATVVTVSSISLSFSNVQSIQEFVTKLLLTMSFSVLFYNYLGKWFIDTVFLKVKNFITNKFSSTKNVE